MRKTETPKLNATIANIKKTQRHGRENSSGEY